MREGAGRSAIRGIRVEVDGKVYEVHPKGSLRRLVVYRVRSRVIPTRGKPGHRSRTDQLIRERDFRTVERVAAALENHAAEGVARDHASADGVRLPGMP